MEAKSYVKLIRRNPMFLSGYKEYCQEFYDHNIIYFRPTNRFIGEFQLRTELTEKVMTGIGSIGYSVRVTEQGKGLRTEILRQGLDIAREHHLEKALLTINDQNTKSAHICEKLGGVLMDKIAAYKNDEGEHVMRRYWIYL